MKTLSIFVTLLVMGTTIFITSCDRQATVVVEPDGSRQGIAPIAVVEGRLKFADSQTFGKSLGELYKNANFDEWEKQFKGFTSLRAAYKRIDMEEIATNPASLKAVEAIVRKESSPTDGDSYDRSIVDPLLAAIVSEKGLLQVGDSIILHHQYQ